MVRNLCGFSTAECQAWEPALAWPSVGVVLALPYMEPKLAALEQQLAEREVIERDKSVLMTSLQISEAEAMQHLHRHARNANQRLVQVAQKLLSSYRLFNGQG